MNASGKGKLVIISGPSGAGKSTVLREVLETCPLPLELSVSATTGEGMDDWYAWIRASRQARLIGHRMARLADATAPGAAV